MSIACIPVRLPDAVMCLCFLIQDLSQGLEASVVPTASLNEAFQKKMMYIHMTVRIEIERAIEKIEIKQKDPT